MSRSFTPRGGSPVIVVMSVFYLHGGSPVIVFMSVFYLHGGSPIIVFMSVFVASSCDVEHNDDVIGKIISVVLCFLVVNPTFSILNYINNIRIYTK